MTEVIKFGAVGDGIADDTMAVQNALNSGENEVHFPEGDYRITKTLYISSGTHITAERKARIFMCGNVPRKKGDFLLSNKNTESGDRDISIKGGIWDGNNMGKEITKPDIFDKNGYSGAVINLINIENLLLEDMVLANSVTYNIRMAKINNFTVKNIGFYSRDPAFNQDGLHIGGGVRNGVIENIKSLSKGQTNDDMIALNADDSLERVENLGLVCGAIENLTIRNVYAEDCYTFIRMLSIDSPIRNISIEKVEGGCRHYAINMDGARGCKTPLFKEDDRPLGVGAIENIEIDGMNVYYTSVTDEKAMIDAECHVKNFVIKNFFRDMEKDSNPKVPTLLFTNVPNSRLEFSGTSKMHWFADTEKADKNGNTALFTTNKKEDKIEIYKTFDNVIMTEK